MRGSRPGRRGPRPPAEPSQEFKVLQSKATTAFLRKAHEEAADYAKQAIQINPEIFAAHSLLSSILFEMGKKEESLAVLWSGAHTRRETGVWWEVATRTAELGGDDNDATTSQLMYCYSQIVRIDKNNVEARRAKMDIHIEQGYDRKATRECRAILNLRPNDLDTLQRLAELSIKANEASKAKTAYEKALKHYQEIRPDGTGGEVSWSDANIYLELFAPLRQWEEGILTLKSVARWLRGRKQEKFWNEWTSDDCEWDVDDEPRRVKVPGFKRTPSSAITYRYELPLELRAKLGIYRLKLGPQYFREAVVSAHTNSR